MVDTPQIQLIPLSENELREMIRADQIMATGRIEPNGRFIVRNAAQRREYEIRVLAMENYLHTTKWINPNEDQDNRRDNTDGGIINSVRNSGN